MESINQNLAILFGVAQSYKTTFLMHYGYLILEELAKKKLADENKEEDNLEIHGVIICSETLLMKNSFYFGKYSNVFIGSLKKIQMKYIESYEDLVQFLAYFPLIAKKPQFVFIDDIDYFLENEKNAQIRNLKLAYIIKLLSYACNSIEKEYQKTESFFRGIISFRLNLAAGDGKSATSVQNKKAVHNLLKLCQNYTSKIFYLEKSNSEMVFKKVVLPEDVHQIDIHSERKTVEPKFFYYQDKYIKMIVKSIKDQINNDKK